MLLTFFFWQRSRTTTPNKTIDTQVTSNTTDQLEKANDKMTENIIEQPNDNSDSKVAQDNQKFPYGHVSIFFGSQTGTAEGFARALSEEARQQGFESVVVDLEDFDPQELKSVRLSIFLMATYGEGEPTDNAAKFVKWAKNKDCEIPNDYLKDMQFTVFGLGNKQYEHFNAMGKFTNTALEKLGAKRIYKYGEGDDDSSLEEDFETWKENLWTSIKAQFEKDNSTTFVKGQVIAIEQSLPELPFNLIYCSEIDVSLPEFKEYEVHHSTHFYFDAIKVKVIANRELRSPEDDGSTIHIEFDINGSSLEYHTADNLAILPENSDEIIESFARYMDYDLDRVFRIEPKEKDANGFKVMFPSPSSIRNALKCYCDLVSIPRKTTLKHFLPYLVDESEKQRLEFLLSKDGRKDFRKFIEDEERSLVELLTVQFKSFRIPFDHLLNIIPSLQPRYYTISSSSSVYPNQIHVTVSIINKVQEDGRIFNGVCTNYLKKLVPPKSDNDKALVSDVSERKTFDEWPCCKVFVRPSSFRLPQQPSTPIILIGPGTGIAPMRALLQERQFQKQNGEEVGENILYFGCKSRNLDYLYKEELEEFLANGTISSLHLAFSREQAEKVYVQHKMLVKENALQIWNLIANKHAHIYVCGGISMGADVHKAIVKIAQEFGELSEADATLYVKTLQNESRYIQELWA